MKQERKTRLADALIFAVLLLAASAALLYLFYKQAKYGSPDGDYASDMRAYILEMQGSDSGYSFPYPVYFKLSALINLFVSPQLAVALAAALLNAVSMVVTKCALNRMTLPAQQKGLGYRILLSVLTVSLFFLSMLFPPGGIFYLPGIKFRYLGVFTGNPFHNATYLAARPFAILALLSFGKLLPVYEKGCTGGNGAPEVKDYIWFSVFLLAATMTKPSFTLILVSTAGLVMLFRMIAGKFRTLVPTLQLGLCFVPTFIDLLYQYSGVFAPDDTAERGIGFCLGEVWGYYCENIPLGICLAIAFPIVVLIFNFRKIKTEALYRFTWELYLVSFLEAFFLYEKGFRKPDFNFSWGYLYGIFFCQLVSLMILLKASFEKKTDIWKLVLQWGVYLCHLICGMFYFAEILAGGTYY